MKQEDKQDGVDESRGRGFSLLTSRLKVFNKNLGKKILLKPRLYRVGFKKDQVKCIFI